MPTPPDPSTPYEFASQLPTTNNKPVVEMVQPWQIPHGNKGHQTAQLEKKSIFKPFAEALMHVCVVGVCVTNSQHGSLMHARVHVCTGSGEQQQQQQPHVRLHVAKQGEVGTRRVGIHLTCMKADLDYHWSG